MTAVREQPLTGVSLPCQRVVPAAPGIAQRRRYAPVRFTYPAVAMSGSPHLVRRTLVLLNAEGDTLMLATCMVPNSDLGMRLSDALFDKLGTFTTAPLQRSGRGALSATIRLASTRRNPAQRSGAVGGEPVCLAAGPCVMRTPPARDVALSAGTNPPAPEPPYNSTCFDNWWNEFFGGPCDYSMPNGGGGGAGWDPDVIVGLPSDANLEYYCDSGVANGTCLRPLTAVEYVVVQNAMSRFRALADLKLISQACADGAFMIQYMFDHGQILAGTNGAGANGLRHLAEYGTDQTPSSPTYGKHVIHIDYAFLAEVEGGVLNGIDYSELDLANVLLHEGMHAWTNGATYSHGANDAVPLTQPGFNMVNPRTKTTQTSMACVQ